MLKNSKRENLTYRYFIFKCLIRNKDATALFT